MRSANYGLSNLVEDQIKRIISTVDQKLHFLYKGHRERDRERDRQGETLIEGTFSA